MDTEKFLKEYYPNCDEWTRVFVSSFQRRLNKYTVEHGSDIKSAFQDADFLVTLFTAERALIPSVSQTSYFRVKKVITKIAEFEGIEAKIPTWEYILETTQMVGFYKDLHHLLQSIDDVGVAALGQYYNPRRDLIYTKAIALLCWYGYTFEQMVEIKRYDSLEPFIQGGRFSDEAAEILRRLGDMDGYTSIVCNGNRRNKALVFKGDPNYLFRPTRASKDRIDPVDLSQHLKRFNTSVPDDMNTVIIFTKLKRNALYVYFNDLEKREVEADLLPIVESYLDCNFVKAYTVIREYQIWRKVILK